LGEKKDEGTEECEKRDVGREEEVLDIFGQGQERGDEM